MSTGIQHQQMNTLIQANKWNEALTFFDQQQQQQRQSSFLYTLALKACAQLKAFDKGVEIHRRMPSQLMGDSYVCSSLINFYMQCGHSKQARDLFDASPKRSVSMVGAMMKGFISNNEPQKALNIMREQPIEKNAVILTLAFKACGLLCQDDVGWCLFDSMRVSFHNDYRLMTSALHMFVECNNVQRAEHVFSLMKSKTTLIYGLMMKGFIANNEPQRALDIFERMTINEKIQPDAIVSTLVFKACAELTHDIVGRRLFQSLAPSYYHQDTILMNSAIYMFIQCKDIERAEKIFAEMKDPTAETVGMMMKGYNTNLLPLKTLSLFDSMQHSRKEKNIESKSAFFILAIKACTQLGMLSKARAVAQHIPSSSHRDKQFSTVLINMWARCGDIKEARRTFDSIAQPDVFPFTALINGYGVNGMGEEAVKLFYRMPPEMRNDITYTCVLNACSHSGLDFEARQIFDANPRNRSDPIIVNTMIDCLSRLFLFDEAEALLVDFEKHHPPSPVMHMALLSGIRTRHNAPLSKRIYERMQRLCPEFKNDLTVASILVANTLASSGLHDEAAAVRKQGGPKTKMGCTWTDINGKIEELHAHDRSHRRIEEIHVQMKRFAKELSEDGHHFDSSWVTTNKNDVDTQTLLCGHSEKLALALNFISTPIPSPIQITKNLRTCGDCHAATKRIARIHKREIIMRDANRIHHFFTNGECSCNDHF